MMRELETQTLNSSFYLKVNLYFKDHVIIKMTMLAVQGAFRLLTVPADISSEFFFLPRETKHRDFF